MTTEQVLTAQPQTREKKFLDLYKKAFPTIARYIARRGGALEDARDIFQDAVILYYEKLVEGKLSIQVNEEAYLLGIARHLWLKKYRLDSKNVDIDDAGNITAAVDHQPLTGRLIGFMERAGERCMNLLKAFYYDRLNMAEIAEQHGFSGERSATVQKYKCLEKVRDMVKQKALHYEDFVE